MLSDRQKRDYRLLYSISMKPCANAIIMYQLNVGSVCIHIHTQTDAHRDSENIYTHFGNVLLLDCWVAFKTTPDKSDIDNYIL